MKVPGGFWDTISQDGIFASQHRRWLRLLHLLAIGHGEPGCLVWLRLAQYFQKRDRPRAARFCARTVERRFQCYVSLDASIGPGLHLPHPTGIVIGAGVTIGANCVLYQQVTLGAARRGDWKKGFYPVLGNDVTCFAGARIIGQLQIGDGAVIGANAVVLRDVAADHAAVGVPARAIPRRIEPVPAAHAIG